MRNKVDFEFTKDWGLTKKGTTKNVKIARARDMQDVHKVGKIKRKPGPKAMKPKENKADKKAIQRETK